MQNVLFTEALHSSLAPFHLLKHPFYQAWMNGTLTVTQLQNYGAQYYPHVNAFPRYISAVHNNCEDDGFRRELAMNLADEEGIQNGKTHPELWLDFCAGLGVSAHDVKSSEVKPAAQALCDGYHTLSRSSYAAGLGALYAYEYQVPEISKTKIEGLETQYDIKDKKTVEFFRVHEEADVYHSQTCLKALAALSAEEKVVAEKAAVEASKLLWDFLSETYAVA